MGWGKQVRTWFYKTDAKICSPTSISPYFEQNPGLKARIHKYKARERLSLTQ